MAGYNVVVLTFGVHSHTFYGRQDEHNHEKNKKFVQAATNLMVQQYGCNYNDVSGGNTLMINQNEPGNGNQLKWVPREKGWKQA